MDNIVPVFDRYDDIILVDDIPYAQHYTEYEGTYEVTPVLNIDQTLETADKVLKEDVTVKPIPVVYTSNPYNGQTVLIG